MKLKPSMLTLGLALFGSLGTGIGSASAQSLYFETYPEPVPIVAPYEVVMAPRYVVRPTVVVVFDAVTDTISIVTPVRPEAGVAAAAAYESASRRLAALAR